MVSDVRAVKVEQLKKTKTDGSEPAMAFMPPLLKTNTNQNLIYYNPLYLLLPYLPLW